MSRRNDLLSYAPITLLVCLMSFFYAIFMVTLIPPLVDSDGASVPGFDGLYPHSDLVNVIVVNWFMVLVLVSFLRASFSKPGLVPSVHPWDPDCPSTYSSSEEMHRALADKGFEHVRGLERKMDGRARFCRMCGKYKPDRAHHSSNMGMCILEMDHYCPWIRNCVGYFNKKYFFLLVLYGSCTLVGYCVALGPRFVNACQHMKSILDFFIVFSWILAAMLGFVVTCFCLFHIYLMLHAYTTIEYCEKRRADDSKRNSQGYKVKELYVKSPYDLGWYRNLCHVLGPMWSWFIPTRIGMPNGVSAGCIFDINPDHPMYQNLLKAKKASRAKSSRASLLSNNNNNNIDSPQSDSYSSSRSTESSVSSRISKS